MKKGFIGLITKPFFIIISLTTILIFLGSATFIYANFEKLNNNNKLLREVSLEREYLVKCMKSKSNLSECPPIYSKGYYLKSLEFNSCDEEISYQTEEQEGQKFTFIVNSLNNSACLLELGVIF